MVTKQLLVRVSNRSWIKFQWTCLRSCKKASQKLNAISRIAFCMTFDQRRLILNSFITSRFCYCPIVWMSYCTKLYERITHIHERAPRIVYKDFKFSFLELIVEDNSLNTFITEICKSLRLKSSKLKMTYQLSLWMMFSSLLKNHTHTNNFTFQVEEDPYNKIWHRNTFFTWPQIMESCSKWI